MSDSNMTFVRWTPGAPREGRVFDNAGENGAPCFLCSHELGDGQPVQLLAVGPDGDDEEQRAKAAAGRVHNAVALILHASCLQGRPVAEVVR